MAVPVLVTKCAYYNFLREYWLGCYKRGYTPQQLVCEASAAWQGLQPSERLMFEEGAYIGARLAVDLLSQTPKKIAIRDTRATGRLRKLTAKSRPNISSKLHWTRRPKRVKKSKLNRRRSD
ncbi:uncharacterized protein [Drosophila virilis]|uniref:Uncharacterized protein n=1 Tax=Drosophila virilis TaxID=7244 RepID=A0A0Q9WT48_DROVI|nr:uncharacterized protein LOC26531256 [Drosophila virilis]KRF83934.1 uncharacterized protein Dvir_GJ26486 [Drosophila virilis]